MGDETSAGDDAIKLSWLVHIPINGILCPNNSFMTCQASSQEIYYQDTATGLLPGVKGEYDGVKIRSGRR